MNFSIQLNNPTSFDTLKANTLTSNIISSNNMSSNSFLSLHQFQSFPTNTAEKSLIVSNDPNNTYNRGVLAPNNKIYCFPRRSENVLIIDPVANTTDITSITGLSNADNKWLGGAVAPNGKIYGIPYVANQVLQP